MHRALLATAFAATTILGTTPAFSDAAKPARQCFSVSRIANWAMADANTVYVRVEGGAVFEVTLAGQCLKPARVGTSTLSFASSLGDDVCRPVDLTVIATAGIAPLRCQASGLRRLTPEEVAALPAGSKP